MGTRIDVIPRLDVSLMDELFYQEDEIAEMRHEAFMIECGLHGDDYCQLCYRMKGPVDDDSCIKICDCGDTSEDEKIQKKKNEFEINTDSNGLIQPHEQIEDIRIGMELEISDTTFTSERTTKPKRECEYSSNEINQL